MEIKHDMEAHRVWIEIEGQTAVVEYEVRKGVLDIIHTYVPPALEGRGIAGRLVKFTYDYGLQQGYKLAAGCSYAAVWLRRNPQYVQ